MFVNVRGRATDVQAKKIRRSCTIERNSFSHGEVRGKTQEKIFDENQDQEKISK